MPLGQWMGYVEWQDIASAPAYLPLATEHKRKVVHAIKRVGMVLANRPFTQLQRIAMRRLGLSVFALVTNLGLVRVNTPRVDGELDGYRQAGVVAEALGEWADVDYRKWL